MKTTTVLGSFLVISMATLAGCAAEDGDGMEASEDQLQAEATPTTTDEYAKKVGTASEDVRATGPQTLPIPGLTVAPAGDSANVEGRPPTPAQSKSNPDWVIDLSKIQFGGIPNMRIGFDKESKVVFKRPTVTVDHNIGPARLFGSKRLNHFDATLKAAGQMRAVVEFETLDGKQVEFNTGENGIPDPEFTIPLFDAPIMFPVFGIPVQIRPSIEVKVGCHLELAAAGKVKAGAEYGFDIQKGVEFNFYNRYSKDPSINFGGSPDAWGPEHDSDFSGDRIDTFGFNTGGFHVFPDLVKAPAPKPIFEAKVKAAALANCFVEPRLSVSLYEFLGATVRVRPYAIGVLQADTEQAKPFNYSVRWGVKGGAMVWAKFPILGRRESPEFQLLDLGGDEGSEIHGAFSFTK